jgi:hypothetical protein
VEWDADSELGESLSRSGSFPHGAADCASLFVPRKYIARGHKAPNETVQKPGPWGRDHVLGGPRILAERAIVQPSAYEVDFLSRSWRSQNIDFLHSLNV